MKFRLTQGDRLVLFCTALTAMFLSSAAREPRRAPMHSVADEYTRSDDAEPGTDAHGRGADSPAAIPRKGWWDILKRVARQFLDDRIMTEAAAITFYALLALFPALAALVSLYGLFANPTTIADQMNGLSSLVPGGGMQIISDQVHRLASSSSSALGIGLVIGLASSLWSANQAIKAVFDALNVVYDEREKRSYLLRTLVSFAFTLGTILFLLIAMAGVVALPIALNFIGLGETMDVLLRLLRWPFLLVAIAVFLAFVYRYGPSRKKARWRWVSWGAAFAALIWVIGSVAFSWYVSNFGNYNKTYGSLGAVIGFMTWIWLSGMIVLVGAEIDAEMEHQTVKDTTIGSDKPLGTRGAAKADTVGKLSG